MTMCKRHPEREATQEISGPEWGLFDLGPRGAALCDECAQNARDVGFPTARLKRDRHAFWMAASNRTVCRVCGLGNGDTVHRDMDGKPLERKLPSAPGADPGLDMNNALGITEHRR